MSWFSEFAGKAEDLLNRVDKTAAVALQKSDSDDERPNRSPIQSYTEYESVPQVSEFRKHSSALSNPLTMRQSLAKSTYNPPMAKTKNNKTDDQLLEFLNAPAGNDSVKSRTTNVIPVLDTVNKKEVEMKLEEACKAEEEPNIIETQEADSKADSQEVPLDVEVKYALLEQAPDEEISLTVIPKASENNAQFQIQNLETVSIEKGLCNEINFPDTNTKEQENFLLKEEIKSLSKEIEILEKKSKEADGENKRLKKQLEHWNSQISGSETIIRELRDQQTDLTTALKAKDAQLAVLRVRLQEADQEKNTHKERAELLKTENDRLFSEHANVSEVHSEALESLSKKCQETETALRQEQDARKQTEMEAFQQYSTLEEEKRQLMENISTAQRQLADHKTQVKDINQQLRSSRAALDTARQDLSDYRQKAQRILQSKEKLISTLKENRSMDVCEEVFSEIDTFNKSGATLSETDDLIQRENDSLREELRESQAACENLRAEMRELEHNHEIGSESWKEKLKILEDGLRQEKQKKEEVESELGQLKEELKFLREDLTRTKTNMQSRVKDRELEVEKLRRQLTTKSLSQSSQSELETRIRTLTENLIQKQTLVEALSTEKNSLVMQMERLEQKMKDFQVPSGKAMTAHIVGITDEGLKNRLPVVFNESPYDSNMTRRVKRAYGVIDSFSIRMGSFLRRYPASRAFLLSYMVLLHFWVFAVLITYQPEIHGKHSKNLTGL